MGKVCGQRYIFFMYDFYDVCLIFFFYNFDYIYFYYSGIIKIFLNVGFGVVYKCRIVFFIVIYNCR